MIIEVLVTSLSWRVFIRLLLIQANISWNLLNKDQLFNHCFYKICTAEVYFFFYFSCCFFFRTEAGEYIHMGALNGLFVLGRSVGFIGKSSIFNVFCCWRVDFFIHFNSGLKKSWKYRLNSFKAMLIDYFKWKIVSKNVPQHSEKISTYVYSEKSL